MFYKKDFLDKEEINLYENEGSLEFAIAMKEHFKNNKEVKIKAILAKEKNNINPFSKRKVVKYIPVFEDKFTITITGYHSANNSYYLKSLERRYPNHLDLLIEDVNVDLKVKNQEFYDRAKELIKDYHKLENSVIVNDKEGKGYRIDIYSHTDTVLDTFLTQDSLYIYDLETNEKIGHIKAKYSTTEMYDFYFPTVVHEFLNDVSKSYLIKNCESKEDILKVLEKERYIKEVDYSDIDKAFKKAEKELYKRQKEYIDDSRQRWINVATTEYSSLETREPFFDPEDKIDYRNKGLAQLMYFYMAKHFTSKGITFRSSTMLNEHSQKAWDNLLKNFPDNIEIATLNNEKIFQFKVQENENVNFESGKLQHKTELSEFLENKTKTKKTIQQKIN